jgi:hypothetical protein
MFRITALEYLESLRASELRLSPEGRRLLAWLDRRYAGASVVFETGEAKVIRLAR